MKITKWWIDNRVLEKNRWLRYWNIFWWVILWIRVNLLTLRKEKKVIKHDLNMGNISYRKMKRNFKNNYGRKWWIDNK